MSIHYYLTVFPMEALIASELEAVQFGTYMAVGARKGSAEQLMFMKIKGDFTGPFDWESARKSCVSHPDGQPKHSLYLSIYRVLENIPVEAMGQLYLITRDGRTLQLDRQEYKTPANWPGFALYKELCPVTPLVASKLNPKDFGEYMTNPDNKTSVPTLMFSDIKIIRDLDNLENSGNIGNVYDRHPEHLKSCIDEIRSETKNGKINKIVDRTYGTRFSYQLIDNGIYVSKGKTIIRYPMPDIETLKKNHYDWGKSADIF